MENRFSNQQQPIFDPNALDENIEIVFDYDENGNLKRVRKVRRYEFGPGQYFFIAILIIVFFVYIYSSYEA